MAVGIDAGLTLAVTYDEAYPVAGIDQPSQQFRDNFAIIKESVENLQSKTIDVTGDVSGTSSIFDSGTGPASLTLNLPDLIAGGTFPLAELTVDTKGRITTITDVSSDYVRTDGTNAMSADLNLGSNDIVNVGNINGIDINAINATTTAIEGSGTGVLVRTGTNSYSTHTITGSSPISVGNGGGSSPGNITISLVTNPTIPGTYMTLPGGASNPGAPTPGTFYYNNTSNELRYYDGSVWQTIQDTTSGSGIGAVVDDGSPQLGGDLDVNGQSIITATGSNGDIAITPDGTGQIILDGLNWPTADGTNGQVLTTDGSGNLSFTTVSGGSQDLYETVAGDSGTTTASSATDTLNIISGDTKITTAVTTNTVTITTSAIENIVDDTTPQLGGNLDVNGNSIVSTGGGDITLTPDTTGRVVLDGLNYPDTDGTNGQVLTTDGGGNLSFTTVSGSSQDLWQTINADTGSASAGSPTDTLTITGGTDISTSISGNTLTIDFTGTSGTTQNLYETIDGDSGTTTASTTTSTLNIISGDTKITTAVTSDTVTITTSAIENVVDDTTPQLGGNLDVNGQSIITATGSNGNIVIAPDGSGQVILDGLNWPSNDGTNGQVLTTDGSGNLSFTTVGTGGSGISAVVDDGSPQLGGDLDVNAFSIVSTAGGDITLTPDTTGRVVIDGLNYPDADGTNGQVLTTNGSGNLSFTTVSSQNLWQTIDADTGATSAGTPTDTLIVAGGTDISTTMSGNTLTIDFVGNTALTNFNATTDPTASDDSTQGYSVGSVWINTSTDEAYRLVDDTAGSAVWINTTLTTTELATVAVTGDYADLTGSPTQLSAFTNDVGYITEVLDDTTPELGGDLDVNGQSIVSASGSNGNIPITPDGTGQIILDGLNWPTSDGTNGQVLTTDGSGNLSFTTVSGSSQNLYETVAGDSGTTTASTATDTLNIVSGDTKITTAVTSDTVTITTSAIENVIDDTTPQLGGNLDVNGNEIVSTGGGDITLTPDTTGRVVLDGLNYPDADGTNGQVLTTDGAGNLSFTTVSGGSQDLWQTIDADTGSTSANSATDTLTIAGGTDISTSISGDTVTINFTGTSGSTQNLYETFTGDSGSTTADSTNDSMAVVGGTNITTAVTTDTITIDFNDPGFLLSVVDDTTPQLGGNLDVQSNTITTSTTDGNVTVVPDGDGSFEVDGVLHTKRQTASISDNNTAVFYTFDATNESTVIEYGVARSGDGHKTGQLLIINDGGSVNMTDTGSELGSPGVTFSAAIVSGNVEVSYTSTSTGNTGTLAWHARLWSIV
jgi:hypothetical protein